MNKAQDKVRIRPKILAAGMMPPPIGGQALMFETAVKALDTRADVWTVDLQVQGNIGEAGLLSLPKLRRFAAIVGRILLCAARGAPFDVLYYCPSGPSKIGAIKDIICLALLRPVCRKTVYHFHATGGVQYLLDSNPIIAKLARKSLWKPDISIRCALVSPDDAALCESRVTKIVVNGIPDPLDLYPDGWQWRRPDSLILTFVGAMTEEKGIFDIVELARLLQSKGLDPDVRCIGEGTYEEVSKFDKLVREHGLENNVRRLGVRNGREKFDLIGSSAFFIFPTFFRAETQPLAVIEASAMGVPSVVSDWRGLRSIVEDGVNGYVLPVRDMSATADCIAQAWTCGDLESLSAKARQKFETSFKLDVFEENISRAILDTADES
ncbi:glycosyltransferase family 4 protein [Novosphingobium mangrovi (ex Huang et al. 2023)]|uniref:Glycosyltransferase n=1 Tax=Novosphingobium mangrovi (ex Huang et al. 2023) TaxID=2976432 RepID=A0ABT2HZU9_9SPHN|nr:glycosyltransferase [Novosphingobium mangrovi (ex Huang et al. 2023)]MCT2398072.1 glycosyltransferase [Novosphingobium mangrovi (ex Huang et al. 2023)]